MRFVASLAAGLGVALVPLSWSVSGSWAVAAGHALFTGCVVAAVLAEAVLARPERARWWVVGHGVTTLAAVAGWQAAFQRGALGWGLPWLLVVSWSMAPSMAWAVVEPTAWGWRRWRTRRAVVARKASRARSARLGEGRVRA